jgi:hypothetical protein
MNDVIKQRLAELHARAPVKRKKQEPFVKVPLALATKVAKATGGRRMLVWLYLLFQSWRRQQPSVTVSSTDLKKLGVGRQVKVRALRDLEAAGLIVVEWRANKNPVATFVQ